MILPAQFRVSLDLDAIVEVIKGSGWECSCACVHGSKNAIRTNGIAVDALYGLLEYAPVMRQTKWRVKYHTHAKFAIAFAFCVCDSQVCNLVSHSRSPRESRV